MFTIKVGVNLLLKGGLIHVTRANADTKGDSFFFGLACNVSPYGNARIDTPTFLEKSTNSTTRTLGSHKDNINIFRRYDVGVIFENYRETMGEIESLALGNERSKSRPRLRLSCIRKEVHDNSSFSNGLFDGEKSLTGYPATFEGLFPALTVFADTNNDVEAVVMSV